MIRVKKFWKPYRPWHVIGDNNGQVHIERQWSGLSSIDMAGKTVIDIGCAEGLVSLKCEAQGASLVHGVELRPRAVEVARSLAGYSGVSDHVKFFQGDLAKPVPALNQPGMNESYDIVIANAVIQKVKSRAVLLMDAIMEKAHDQLIIRLPLREVQSGRSGRVDPVERAGQAGFEMVWEACGYPAGVPPFPLEGEAWLALFRRTSKSA